MPLKTRTLVALGAGLFCVGLFMLHRVAAALHPSLGCPCFPALLVVQGKLSRNSSLMFHPVPVRSASSPVGCVDAVDQRT
jgi:hypothetical protein